jgi:hypothetical protein
VTLHIRRTDKVGGKCIVDPHNPAYSQLPGFNRTFDEYMRIAEAFTGTAGPGAAHSSSLRSSSAVKLFLLSDDAEWVGRHVQARAGSTSTGSTSTSSSTSSTSKNALPVAMLAGHGLMVGDELPE